MMQQAAMIEDAPAAMGRKERSERILDSEGVPVNSDLPPLQHAIDIRPRSKEEIAYRTLCVLMTAIKAERMDQTMVLRVIRQYGLAAKFSQVEKEFIRNAAPTVDDNLRFSWRYETAWALLWALGYVDALGIPNSTCDVAYVVGCMRDRTTQTFISDAHLRPIDQIADQADLIYRYQWAITDAGQNKREIPAGLNAVVVHERSYVLNWLIRYKNKEWDDVGAYA